MSTAMPGTAAAAADVETGVRAGLSRVAPSAVLLGRPLRLVAVEEECTEAGGRHTAGRLVAQGAHVVIGHVCSSAALVAAPVYARHGMIMISPGARAARLTHPRAGSTIFRLAARDDRFGQDVARFILERHAGSRVGVVHDKSRQASRLADDADRSLRALGVVPTLREAYIAGERAYHELTTRLATAAIDVIVMPAQPMEAGIILSELDARGLTPTLIGSEILAVPGSIEPATRYGSRWLPMLAAPLNDGSGEMILVGSDVAHRAQAALEAWVAAVRRSGTINATTIAQALVAAPAATLFGNIRFDHHGDVMRASFLPHVWRGGEWRPLAGGQGSTARR